VNAKLNPDDLPKDSLFIMSNKLDGAAKPGTTGAQEMQSLVATGHVRGVVGEFLTPALACAFAQAFGSYVGAGRVVVGRDSRSSGPMLQHAVTCGLLASGCEVIDVGVMPTKLNWAN
jgi:phosphomannomutase